ncbi:MAG: C39 family peptidase [Planctomycetia bacterium]|nr:C39 family peptidase [Planctomycetia bacterium]
MRGLRLAAFVLLLPLAFSGCQQALTEEPRTSAVTPESGAGSYASVLIDDVPHVRQKPDFCGEACVAMWLARLAHDATQDDVFNFSGLDPAEGRGCYTRELVAAVSNLGFKRAGAWHEIAADDADAIEAHFAALHADLTRGVPSIVCMHYDDRAGTTEHFRLVLGYDADKDEVVYHEPAADRAAYQRMDRAKFQKLWPLRSGRDAKRLVVRIPLEKEKLAERPRKKGLTSADYAQHVLRLKEKLPEGFSVVVQEPFVVVGDEPLGAVRRRAENTVKWAVDRLQQDYFEKEPERILEIWLFQDKESYEQNVEAVFGETPTTPFGYYSARHGALIMNIATGGGTLVHEIVHPFIAANFPGCPSWFNEGLASLYEQAADRDGHIVGLTNWRLSGLQKSIRGKSVPSFATLCGTSTNEFYGDDRGTNYAQARYLCYYLQENGLLVKYYHAFRKNVKDDPTGYETLKETLGASDMRKFQAEWEDFVSRLKFE